jgi:hypothetical protein
MSTPLAQILWVSEETSYSQGLHVMLEANRPLKIRGPNETLSFVHLLLEGHRYPPSLEYLRQFVLKSIGRAG